MKITNIILVILLNFVTCFVPQFSMAKVEKIIFELPTINNSNFVSNQNFFGKKTILLFFDIDCPPCIKKLNNLKEKTPDLTKINFAVINLSANKEAKNAILQLALDSRIELLQAPSNSKVFLRKFGNNQAKLPFLALLNEEGILCNSKSEMFDNADIENCF